MGKYSDIVKSKNQVSEPENQETVNVENKKTIKQENHQSGNNAKSKTAARLKNQKTSKPESIKTGKPESIKTSKPESQKTIEEEMVNLSIKVPRRLRQKWVAESRLRGTTLTTIITEYLKTELGE